MLSKKLFAPLVLGLLAFGSVAGAKSASSFEKEEKAWRKQRESKLLEPMSWLEAIGLFWLQKDETSVGSSETANFKVPAEFPKSFALIHYYKEGASIEFPGDFGVLLDNKKVDSNVKYNIAFAGADQTHYTTINYKTFSIIFIERGYGRGMRVYDTDAPAKKNFKGQNWFPPSLKFKINAKWIPLQEEKKLAFSDTLGHISKERSSGYAVFTIDGIECKLYPTDNGDGLFFIFKDGSSGKETYGAGRFLMTPKPEKDTVELDFNHAENPPCAISPFGTCPLPPPENNCAASINAGEMKL
jgi:uncharacterized protein (DUF1684 family)